MGMSASQARLLQLTGEKNDLEFQGQKINQERSDLASQTTELYNSLLALQVPTPPSTSDYTRVVYRGATGTTNFTIGTVIPEGGSYTVDLEYTKVGHFMEESNYTSQVTDIPDTFKATDKSSLSGTATASQLLGLYLEKGGVVTVITQNDLKDKTKFNESGGIYTAAAGYKIYQKDVNGTVDLANPDTKYKTDGGHYIAGQPSMSLKTAQAEGRITAKAQDDYIDALKNAYADLFKDCKTDDEVETVVNGNFQVYFTKNEAGNEVPHFVRVSDFNSIGGDVNGNKYITPLDYVQNGTYTETQRTSGCLMTFDSSGRITKIQIPTEYNGGVPTNYSTATLEAVKETDDAAYQDAYEKYKYKQYEYDKRQAEINAKMEIIQQEDRTLELRLQRLDTERQQITTELDALDKVIKDNIDKSYKTFSG